MRKLILGVGACFMGLALSIKSEVPADLSENLAALRADVNVLVVQDVSSVAKREELTKKLELDIALAVGKLNELAEENKIEMQDAVEAIEDYARLWVTLTEWKEGVVADQKNN